MLNSANLFSVIDAWIRFLDQYTMEQVLAKPAAGKWSIGQLYIHLIQDSHFYIEQAIVAQNDEQHTDSGTSAEGRELLHNNSFPDKLIEGHPSNAFIPQPKDKSELADGLRELQQRVLDLVSLQTAEPSVGKSQHPGLGYLTLQEWLQLMDMHFRHHLKQKQRIDQFLNNNKE